MAILSRVFTDAGYSDVTPILASGNVIFNALDSDTGAIGNRIESAIQSHFKFSVPVQVWRLDAIQSLVRENPFHAFVPDPNVHWYVTFLDQNVTTLPPSFGTEIQFISLSNRILCSVLDRSAAKTVDFMTLLDQNFGKKVTTRNWNTVLKIVNNSKY